jgi:hypothetical protein
LAIKLQTSSGFRAIQKIIGIYILYMGLNMKEPSYSSILIWTKKVGLFQLEIQKDQADDWIIILDESIEFGHDKLLVIYGISSKKVNYESALNYQDLIPLTIVSGDSWTGALIEKEIEKIERDHGKIIYAVADGGNAIRKALRLKQIPHIYDITHKFAWFLKEIYKEEEEFKCYIKIMAKMRGTLALSNISHVLPPNQRFHSRYMNLDILSDWGLKVLNYLDLGKTNERAFKELIWVKDYEMFIKELAEVNSVLAKIKALLKIQSMSIENVEKTKSILQGMKTKNLRTERFKNYIAQFLEEQLALLPEQKKIVCTSDIIESAFGKYKNYISNNPMVGITNLALVMAAFTAKLDTNKVMNAMEKVKVKDLKQWSEKNIGETNLQKRKKVLRKVG